MRLIRACVCFDVADYFVPDECEVLRWACMYMYVGLSVSSRVCPVTGQLADSAGDFACLVFAFGGICDTASCPVRELTSPRNVQSTSWQSASWSIRELSSYRGNNTYSLAVCFEKDTVRWCYWSLWVRYSNIPAVCADNNIWTKRLLWPRYLTISRSASKIKVINQNFKVIGCSVPEMTYNVFSGTLNPTHFTS